MKYLAAGIVSFLVLVGGILFGHSIVPSSPSFGSTAFTPVSGKTYYLSGAGISSSQNTITLSSFTLPDPNNTPIQSSMFSGTQYGVLEAQTSKTEDITFTGVTQNTNGTATLTGVTRGISFYSPFVASTTLQLAHAGGATFILSNPAAFYAQFLTNTNNNSIYGTFTFSSTSPPVYDADPIWANFSTQALADVSYVNSVVAAGCANASETIKGCSQLSTGPQAAIGTSFGSTGARLVVPNSLATSTPYSGTPAGSFPTSNAIGGKISQFWLDLTQPFSWSGIQTYGSGFIDNASSTFTAALNINGALGINKVNYTFPSTQGTAGTTFINNGSGILSNGTPANNQYSISSSTNSVVSPNTTISSASINVPAGILTASSTITFMGAFQCLNGGTNTNNCTLTISDGGGDTFASFPLNVTTSATCNEEYSATVTSNNSLMAQIGIGNGISSCGGSPTIISVSGSAAANFANATSFLVKLNATNNSGNVSTIEPFSIIVRP